MQMPPPIESMTFMAGVLVVFIFIVTVAAHFPAEARRPSLRGTAGTALIFCSSALVATSAIAGLILAYHAIPWYAAVIGGGAMILAAPYTLHPLSDDFVNGPSALIVLGALAMVVTLVALILIY